MLAAATQRMADLVPVLIKTIGEQAAQLRNVEALQTQVKALDTKQADALRILEAMAAFTTSAAAAQNAKQQQQKQDQEQAVLIGNRGGKQRQKLSFGMSFKKKK